MSHIKTGRNDPCPCGSGKKLKLCCSTQNKFLTRNIPLFLNMPHQPAQSHSTQISNEADKHFNMGNALQTKGNPDAAVECYRKAILLKPDSDKVYNNLGLALEAQERLDEAAECYHKAILLNPKYAIAHNNLGNILQKKNTFDMAIEHYRMACGLKPDYPEAHNNMGNAQLARGNADDAIVCFRIALTLKPDYAEAHYNLGNALDLQGQSDAAAESYRKAITLQPFYVSAHNNLGSVLMAQGKLYEAVKSYRHALLIQPDYAECFSNLGNALRDQGKLNEAVENYRKALFLKPDFIEANSNLLLTLSYYGSPEQYLTEAKSYGLKISSQAHPYTSWSGRLLKDKILPLRVGLVTGDLREHPVGFFLESIVAHLNPSRIDLVAYSTVPQEDALTSRIKPRFGAWNTVAGLGDEGLAEKIHQDDVNILIDLAGHFAHNRLPVFARKPAPVQVSWLGYFASTGVPAIDFLLADSVSVPESHREHFTETVFYLPDTRLCFTPPATTQPLSIKPPPAMHNHYITFGCFQGLTKISDGVLATWGRVFRTLPSARLRLQNKQMNCPITSEELLQRLNYFGISQERVTMRSDSNRESYLAAHEEVDIILDTFPFPGGTTTCEALWMGVPTLTLAGETLLARQGASLLECAGLAEWIAHNEADYVEKAVTYASDINQLAQLRMELRQRVLASPLFDAPRFALNLEDALITMWQKKMGT